MSADLAILVPVLDRPHRVKPLLDAVEATTPRATVLFLVDSGDDAEWEAIEAEEDRPRNLTILLNPEGGSYPEKINRGIEVTQEPLVFTGADDLEPQPHWFDFACNALEQYDVVGVNDLIPRRRRRAEHATHFLMTREYAERPAIDGSAGPMFTGYRHCFCDDELIGTARHRGAYVYCAVAHVKHLHPMAGAPDDETYRLGRERFREDRALFYEREHLWT